MIKKISFLILLMLIALLCVGCSGDDTSVQGVVLKPPSVRVEALPTATAAPQSAIVELTETPSPQPTDPLVIYYDPTPDSDAIANEIDSIIADINRKLQNQDLLLKP